MSPKKKKCEEHPSDDACKEEEISEEDYDKYDDPEENYE